MKRFNYALIYLLIFFAGIATGMFTPQSWYPSGPVAPTHANVRASLGK
jgi:hypothetical protein